MGGWLRGIIQQPPTGSPSQKISNTVRLHAGMLVGCMTLLLANSGMSQVTDLAWDNGDTETGSSAVAQPSPAAGDYVYRISIRATDVWRTRLNVSAGEADLYMKKGAIPVPGDGSRASELIGSDGVVLASPDFAPGITGICSSVPRGPTMHGVSRPVRHTCATLVACPSWM